MDLQEIQDKLNTLLDGTERRIVFWYDDDAAYAEEVDQLQLAGDSKVIKLTGSNSFATKLLLEHQVRRIRKTLWWIFSIIPSISILIS